MASRHSAGYEDGNDANRLRSDPVFKMAQDALPSGRDLASQSTGDHLHAKADHVGQAVDDLVRAARIVGSARSFMVGVVSGKWFGSA